MTIILKTSRIGKEKNRFLITILLLSLLVGIVPFTIASDKSLDISKDGNTLFIKTFFREIFGIFSNSDNNQDLPIDEQQASPSVVKEEISVEDNKIKEYEADIEYLNLEIENLKKIIAGLKDSINQTNILLENKTTPIEVTNVIEKTEVIKETFVVQEEKEKSKEDCTINGWFSNVYPGCSGVSGSASA